MKNIEEKKQLILDDYFQKPDEDINLLSPWYLDQQKFIMEQTKNGLFREDLKNLRLLNENDYQKIIKTQALTLEHYIRNIN